MRHRRAEIGVDCDRSVAFRAVDEIFLATNQRSVGRNGQEENRHFTSLESTKCVDVFDLLEYLFFVAECVVEAGIGGSEQACIIE